MRSAGYSPARPLSYRPGYRAWVVPEIVAVKAGALALERALDDGLPSARSASYDGWGSTVQALPTR